MNAPWDLIDGCLDDQLTSEEELRLEAWLKSDPEHFRCFVREAHFHQSLRAELQARRAVPTAIPLPRTVENDAPIVFSQSSGGMFSFRWQTALALAAAIAIAVVTREWFLPAGAQLIIARDSGGSVEVERDGQRSLVAPGSKLLPGDLLNVSGTNSATLSYTLERTDLELTPGSKLKLLSSRRGKQFELVQGEIHAVAAPQPFGKPMILRTAQAEARVVGTRFTLLESTNFTRLEVAEGKVALKQLSDGAEVQVSTGLYAIVSTNHELAALPLTGSVYREYWTNMPGDTSIYLITNPRYPDQPDGREILKQLETPANWGDNYATRIRGYIHPPITGDYTFWIEAKDEASLWLSPDGSAQNRVQMAICLSQDTTSLARLMRQSAAVHLVAGRVYYFEILHKAAVGEDHLAVEWQIPGREREVIDGKCLSPFEEKKWRSGK